MSDIHVMSEPAVAPDEAADFQRVRPRLFGIAYRLLGRVTDAEDVVQDVWLRWQCTDRALVNDRVAFLVKITTRVALNVAVSARVRREVAVGQWPTEQVHAADDPTLPAERLEDLEYAVRLLLHRLSPTERAVFVLREAFGYRFREIAETLEVSYANARQLGRRARARALPRHGVNLSGRRSVIAYSAPSSTPRRTVKWPTSSAYWSMTSSPSPHEIREHDLPAPARAADRRCHKTIG